MSLPVDGQSTYIKIHNVTGKVIRVTVGESGEIVDEQPVVPVTVVSNRTKRWLAARRAAEPTGFWYLVGKIFRNFYTAAVGSFVISGQSSRYYLVEKKVGR